MSEQNSDNRRESRNTCYAKIIANGLPGYVRNLTEGGIGVEFLMSPGFNNGDSIQVGIYPEEETGLEPFSFTAEVQWQKENPPYHDVGFSATLNDSEHGDKLAQLITLYNS